MKHCPECDTTKPVKDFYRDRARRDGLNRVCKPCANKSKRQSMAKQMQPRPVAMKPTPAEGRERLFTDEDIRHMARIVLEGTRRG